MEYTTFRIRKSNGKYRIIDAPDTRLKKKQREILQELEKEIPLSPFCHGFKRGRNMVTNALPHVGKKIVINLDIKDFFPSIKIANFITFNRTKIDAKLLTKITKFCFKTPRRGEPYLPQGAPTSPFLSNLYLRSFDWAIGYYIYHHYKDGDYTRYADDLTISSNDDNIVSIIKIIEHYLAKKGLKLNPKKIRIMRRHNRQEVCGITVNEKINLGREYRKRIRAMKHQECRSKVEMGHYAVENAVYNIEYDPELYTTRNIINAQVIARKLEGDSQQD